MPNDLEIAQTARLRPIVEIGAALGLSPEDIENYGPHKGKVPIRVLESRSGGPQGKLILVTAMTPTPAGEGKTTVTVGLGQALTRLGKRACIAVREPSLGPCFGMKGGAAGGGYSQLLPMDEINLHFTGDFHAITSAHNLLAALLDNHLHFGNALRVNPRQVNWKRVLDTNDRSLRQIVIGLGGTPNGVPRESGFDITAASEIMAIFCLAESLEDLRRRLAQVIVAFDENGAAVTAEMLNAEGSLALLLKEALKPNLVQSLEGTPAFVHGGPFANIAHGCNSVLATRMGLALADVVVTEAGFGADLGAEKFFDIKCRSANLAPSAAVVVATLRALKHHGGAPKSAWSEPDRKTIDRGLPNLLKHTEIVRTFGVPCIVALNRFDGDTDEEIDYVIEKLESRGIPAAVADIWARGGEGGLALGEKVLAAADSPSRFRNLYDIGIHIKSKIGVIAHEVYGASTVVYTSEAEEKIARLEKLGLNRLPICMAKTQYSLSDNPSLFGRPGEFPITVRDLRVSAGAGFIVALTGSIMTMPGLPRHPAAEGIHVDPDGTVHGLF